MAMLKMSAATICILLAMHEISAATVHLWPDGEGTCYRQYIPSKPGVSPEKCRYAIGENPTIGGLFASSAQSCCRMVMAKGWGTASDCQSCAAIRGVFSPWSDWSTCSKTCGWGEQQRHRGCSSHNVCADIPGRKRTETRSCKWKDCCPEDGNWGDYSHWSVCTGTCGTGQQFRTRLCSSPSPSCGGKPCVGSPRDERRCRVRPCAIDGGWCEWSSWSRCTTSCKQTPGKKKQSRFCECPAPSNGGKDCEGRAEKEQPCSAAAFCMMNGGWDAWSPWSTCSSQRCSMIPGVRTRTRKCGNPPPSYGGTCYGSDEEDRPCLNANGCRIEGEYGEWSAWNPCTTSCGSCGIKTRKRECSFPLISMADVDIIGKAEFFCDETKQTEEQPCALDKCPDDSDPCGFVPGSQYEIHGNEDMKVTQSPLFDSGEALPTDNSNDGDIVHSNYDGHETSEYYDDAEYDPGYHDYSGNDEDHYSVASDQNYVVDLKLIQTLEKETESAKASLLGGDSHGKPFSNPLGSGDEIPTELLGESNDYEVHSVQVDETSVPGCDNNVLRGAVGEDAQRAVGCCEILSKMFWTNDDPAAESDLFGLGEAATDLSESTNLSLPDDSKLAAPSTARIEECFSLHFNYSVDASDELGVVSGRSFRGSCKYRGKGKYLRTICCLRRCEAWPHLRLRQQCRVCRAENLCPSCHRLLLSG